MLTCYLRLKAASSTCCRPAQPNAPGWPREDCRGYGERRSDLARGGSEPVKPSALVEMLSPQLDLAGLQETALTTGLPASPGAAVGMLALSANAAVTMHASGAAVIPADRRDDGG